MAETDFPEGYDPAAPDGGWNWGPDVSWQYPATAGLIAFSAFATVGFLPFAPLVTPVEGPIVVETFTYTLGGEVFSVEIGAASEIASLDGMTAVQAILEGGALDSGGASGFLGSAVGETGLLEQAAAMAEAQGVENAFLKAIIEKGLYPFPSPAIAPYHFPWFGGHGPPAGDSTPPGFPGFPGHGGPPTAPPGFIPSWGLGWVCVGEGENRICWLQE